MKYKDFLKTDMHKEADVVYFVDENGQELDLTDEKYFEMEILQANKRECAGVVEVVFKTN